MESHDTSIELNKTIQSEESEGKAKISPWILNDLNSEDSGNLRISVKETTMCKFSRYTGWHLLRAVGLLNFTVYSNFLNEDNIIRLTLKRSHPDYSEFPIERICIKHQSNAPFNTDHVLQPDLMKEIGCLTPKENINL